MNGYAIVGYANAADYNALTNGTSPTINFVDGASASFSDVYNSSTFNMSGGSQTELFDYDSSTTHFSGGSLTYFLSTNETATADVTGGTIGEYIIASGSSNVSVSGGTYPNNFGTAITFYDSTAGSFVFHGIGLLATDAGPSGNGEKYLLTGLLANGSDVTGDFVQVGSGASMFSIVNAPEPSSIALFGLAIAAAVHRQRQG